MKMAPRWIFEDSLTFWHSVAEWVRFGILNGGHFRKATKCDDDAIGSYDGTVNSNFVWLLINNLKDGQRSSFYDFEGVGIIVPVLTDWRRLFRRFVNKERGLACAHERCFNIKPVVLNERRERWPVLRVDVKMLHADL